MYLGASVTTEDEKFRIQHQQSQPRSSVWSQFRIEPVLVLGIEPNTNTARIRTHDGYEYDGVNIINNTSSLLFEYGKPEMIKNVNGLLFFVAFPDDGYVLLANPGHVEIPKERLIDSRPFYL